MTITVKIPKAILLPIASASYRDEHGTPKNDLIYNQQVAGIEVDVELKNRSYLNGQSDYDIDVIGMVHYDLGIDSHRQGMDAKKWLQMVFAIDSNRHTIEEAVQESISHGVYFEEPRDDTKYYLESRSDF